MTYHRGPDAFARTEPAFDAPPSFRDVDERRLQMRAYLHWCALRGGRAMPSAADLDVARLDGLGPFAVLIGLGSGRRRPWLRFVGGRLRGDAAVPGTDVPLTRVPAGTVLARLTERCDEVVTSRSPVRVEAEFTSARGRETLCRGMLMPLSSDGEAIDALFGVINWKEIAPAALTRRIAAELAEALAHPG
jgi:hypothetical protein